MPAVVSGFYYGKNWEATWSFVLYSVHACPEGQTSYGAMRNLCLGMDQDEWLIGGRTTIYLPEKLQHVSDHLQVSGLVFREVI